MTDVLTDERWAVLDPAIRPTDPDEYLRVALHWHFGAETGSRFWLDRAKSLDFDPRHDVRSYDDLRLFPNVVDEFRDIPVEDLIPQGYGPNPPAPRVYETGGTTGAPKRVILMPDWHMSSMERTLNGPIFAGRKPGNILMATPTGPHKIGGQYDEVVKRQNTIKFTIDVDPRWVKKLISRGESDQVKAYLEHVLDQIEQVLISQQVSTLVITPPLLRACAGRPRLVELINAKVDLVFWGGAHMTPDERFELSHVHFPDVRMIGRYNSATMLEGAVERAGTGAGDSIVFDPFTPVVTFRVVDPETWESVDYGQRGQVVVNHVSKGMFVPNSVERDSVVRVPGLPGQLGDSVSDPRPFEKFGGERVIEGIY